MRLPSLMLSSSCLANKRLCAANASRGERSGGTSPTTCKRGDVRGLGDGSPLVCGPCDLDRKSMKFGLFAMLADHQLRGWIQLPASMLRCLVRDAAWERYRKFWVAASWVFEIRRNEKIKSSRSVRSRTAEERVFRVVQHRRTAVYEVSGRKDRGGSIE